MNRADHLRPARDGRPSRGWWIAFGLVVVDVTLIVAPWVGDHVRTSGGAPEWLQTISLLALIPGAMVLACVMWIAETARRGKTGRSATARGSKLLPAGSNRTTLRPLGMIAHLAWLVVLPSVALGLLLGSAGDDGGAAMLLGIALIPVTGAVAGSLVKKSAYAVRERQAARGAVTRPSPFWRWFSFRWRLDLWLCAFAFAALAAGALVAALLRGASADPASFGTPEDIAEATRVTTALLVGGGILAVVGLVACTQAWRSGESLGEMESFA